MKQIKLNEQYELRSDGRTVWLNDRNLHACVGRHSDKMSETMEPPFQFAGEPQQRGCAGYDCVIPGNWQMFRDQVKDRFSVELPETYL